MMQLTGHHIIPIPLMMSLITNRDRYNNAAFDNADRPTGVELQSRRRAQRATDYATDRVEECLIPRSWRSFSHFSPAMIHRRRLCEPPRPSLSGVPRGFVERNGRELSSPFSTISQLCARVIAAGAGAGGEGGEEGEGKGQAAQNESDGPRARDARTCFGATNYISPVPDIGKRAPVPHRFYFLRRSGCTFIALPSLFLFLLLPSLVVVRNNDGQRLRA
jgi:hypothetical protein